VSDLSRSENQFESGDRLLEVYRPVWSPRGSEMLFEMYAPYDQVGQRAGELWRGFAGVTLSSLLLLVVLVAPILWRLLERLRRAQGQRELLLERAVDASAEERRRIAASLHDGPVQELAATSFAVSGAAARAESAGERSLASELAVAATSVRSSIRSLRSLLVDIYPPSLEEAGLEAALTDLVQSVRGRDLDLRLDLDPAARLRLDPERERLVYRVAQECLRNAAKHAGPCTVAVTLYREDDDVLLDVLDDGAGFAGRPWADAAGQAHFGVRVMTDLASSAGALLQVASAPGRGTHWRLVVPLGERGGVER
jgi:two-component system, NarL family, sensor kinase